MTTTLTALSSIPPGGSYTTRAGVTYAVGINGQAVVANSDVAELLATGNFVPLDPNFAGATRTQSSFPVRLQFPPGVTNSQANDGTNLTPGADGTVTVNAAKVDVTAMLRMGCTPVPHSSGATGGRPTVCPTGTLFFDTTLGKPVFRTAAAGWCDATGAAA